ncbi:transposase [Paucibacter sp. DJ2R-2]|nr:transposase [Paucibacter sp. DJ2R-2]
MNKSRFTEEQIVGFLKQAEAGLPIGELCRLGGFSDTTFYRWRAKRGGAHSMGDQRLQLLENENAKLRHMLAEAHSNIRELRGALCVKA